MPTKQIVRPIILPLLLSGLLVQAVVPMVRILTSYRALDEGYGPGMIGLLSAAFSLLPVLLTVTLGRMNDRGALGKVILVGALGTLGACLVFWLGPMSLGTLFVASTLLGIGQTAVLAGLQVATMHASTRAHRDAVLGNYMVAVSLGQASGSRHPASLRQSFRVVRLAGRTASGRRRLAVRGKGGSTAEPGRRGATGSQACHYGCVDLSIPSSQTRIAACASAHRGHAASPERRRPNRHRAVAGSRVHGNDPDVHPRRHRVKGTRLGEN